MNYLFIWDAGDADQGVWQSDIDPSRDRIQLYAIDDGVLGVYRIAPSGSFDELQSDGSWKVVKSN